MTTRRHYPGRHRIDVIINGTAHLLGEFEVTIKPETGGKLPGKL
jgi:hypothetical protein